MKIDINIERDLAYALKVRNCPQILFLRGNRILYREKGEIRDLLSQNLDVCKYLSCNLVMSFVKFYRDSDVRRIGCHDCAFLLQCKEALLD